MTYTGGNPFGHDPEAVYQDADIEQAEAERDANAAHDRLQDAVADSEQEAEERALEDCEPRWSFPESIEGDHSHTFQNWIGMDRLDMRLKFSALDMIDDEGGVKALTQLRDALEAHWPNQADYVQTVLDEVSTRGWKS